MTKTLLVLLIFMVAGAANATKPPKILTVSSFSASFGSEINNMQRECSKKLTLAQMDLERRGCAISNIANCSIDYSIPSMNGNIVRVTAVIIYRCN